MEQKIEKIIKSIVPLGYTCEEEGKLLIIKLQKNAVDMDVNKLVKICCQIREKAEAGKNDDMFLLMTVDDIAVYTDFNYSLHTLLKHQYSSSEWIGYIWYYEIPHAEDIVTEFVKRSIKQLND